MEFNLQTKFSDQHCWPFSMLIKYYSHILWRCLIWLFTRQVLRLKYEIALAKFSCNRFTMHSLCAGYCCFPIKTACTMVQSATLSSCAMVCFELLKAVTSGCIWEITSYFVVDFESLLSVQANAFRKIHWRNWMCRGTVYSK